MIPQALWSRRVRRNVAWLFAISLVVNMGMWLERFVIVVVSLSRDFTPSAWGMYYPDEVGLGDVSRYIWIVLYAVLPLHSFPADDLDRRGAFVGA